jgi:glycosyltransferase involved in cell wall biosynthesis
LEYRKNVIWLHKKDRLGLRRAINESMRITSGKYIMKVDAHCMFDEGFDVKLKSSCEDNWIMVPRRKSLDAPTWTVNKKTPIDYEFIGYPFKDMDASVKVGNVWHDRTKKRINIPIDDLMTFQGSCWFIPKKYL